MLSGKCETNCYHVAREVRVPLITLRITKSTYLLQVLGCVAQQRLRESIPERVERKPCRPCISCPAGTYAFHQSCSCGGLASGNQPLLEPRPWILNNQPRSETASYYCHYCYFSYQTILRHSVSFIKVKRVSCPGALLASSCLLGLM